MPVHHKVQSSGHAPLVDPRNIKLLSISLEQDDSLNLGNPQQASYFAHLEQSILYCVEIEHKGLNYIGRSTLDHGAAFSAAMDYLATQEIV